MLVREGEGRGGGAESGVMLEGLGWANEGVAKKVELGRLCQELAVLVREGENGVTGNDRRVDVGERRKHQRGWSWKWAVLGMGGTSRGGMGIVENRMTGVGQDEQEGKKGVGRSSVRGGVRGEYQSRGVNGNRERWGAEKVGGGVRGGDWAGCRS